MRRAPTAKDRQISETLMKACAAIVTDYRTSVGRLPEWLDELEAADALKLLAASRRVGMKLPPHEMLAGDRDERARGTESVRFRGSRKSR